MAFPQRKSFRSISVPRKTNELLGILSHERGYANHGPEAKKADDSENHPPNP